MKCIKNNLRKILAIYLVGMLLVLSNVRYTYGFPTAPSAPSAPNAPSEPITPPEAPTAPEAPSVPEAPLAPDVPVSPSAPSEPLPSEPSVTPEPIVDSVGNDGTPGQSSEPSEPSLKIPDEDVQPVISEEDLVTNSVVTPNIESTGGIESDEGMGSAVITSGDADNTGAIVNTGANNYLSVGESGYDGGVVVTTTGNGPDTVNTGSVVVSDNNVSSQINKTEVTNNMNQVADSGKNEASKNMAGAEITTGNANVSGTIINSVNTNVDGIMVSEFNIADDHVGDIVLNYSEGCVSGCGDQDIKVINGGNGPDSTNTGDVNLTSNDISFQQNDANVENNMTLLANSGENTANKNMGGETSIATGDANVSAGIVNFVNNNIAGDVVYAVVNIFGNLIGDIIMPEGMLAACCGASDVTVTNTGNGSESTNNTNVKISDADLINQFNNASIENNLIYDANTGKNGLSKDMGGDTTVKTGDAEVVAQVLNVANTNLIAGNAWLVIVNEAGKWIGKILGSDGNANVAGSDGFEFVVNDAGNFLAVNSGNASGSTNTSTINVNDNETFTQVNNANVVNNVNLTANTGKNEADKNMGGSSIVTGDAKIVANIVNFVNNNIIGQGKLFVTVVNVFGGWVGDFVTPGHEQEKDNYDNFGIGGTADLPPETNTVDNPNSNSSNSSGGSSSGESNSSSSGGSSTTVIASVLPLRARVLGARFMNSNSEEENSVEFDTISNDVQVISDAMGKKIVKINMAYGLLLLPLILGFIIFRRKFHFHRLSVR